MPTVEIKKDDIQNELSLVDLVIACNLAPSKGQARTLIEQGGISVDDNKITDTKYAFNINEINNEMVIKKGKKVFIKVKIV